MSITIKIKTMSEETSMSDVQTAWTILELKEAIAKNTEVPAENQRLIYKGKVLKVSPAHAPSTHCALSAPRQYFILSNTTSLSPINTNPSG